MRCLPGESAARASRGSGSALRLPNWPTVASFIRTSSRKGPRWREFRHMDLRTVKPFVAVFIDVEYVLIR